MKGLGKDVRLLHEVGEEGDGQRVDNYLVRLMKGVPRSHIHRILRTGEVRVNSRRVEASVRLQTGDRLRLPPVRTAERSEVNPAVAAGAGQTLLPAIIHEDEALLVLDKPAGVAVHGGSGVSFGVIEALRAARSPIRFLELVHRLDRATSGVLLLAKKRAALTRLHAAMREGRVRKRYLALVHGVWKADRRDVRAPLAKHVLPGGDRRVSVAEGGVQAHTVVRLREAFGQFSLLEAELVTGRTHQIRVHLAHIGYPIAGDDKYGNFPLNKALARRGLRRMFLHAAEMVLAHPVTGERLCLRSELPADLARFLASLRAEGASP